MVFVLAIVSDVFVNCIGENDVPADCNNEGTLLCIRWKYIKFTFMPKATQNWWRTGRG